jgi:L-seryl-tRNA(Ser) seleniumtransferase
MLLKKIPGVDTMLDRLMDHTEFHLVPRRVITQSIREVIDDLRASVLGNDPDIGEEELDPSRLIDRIGRTILKRMTLNLKRVINATGVVIHTNLGRSLLAEEAMAHVASISPTYSNLEFNIAAGRRGIRYSAVEELICDISGAESAMVVNNNAAAVLLSIDTLAKGRDVVVSRGELVEIGGSFRIPDVMEKSGCSLIEVGTTNRTHLRDYENAITEKTGLILKVHTSNYSIVGFTSSVPLKDMVDLGERCNLPVMEDLGSGTFIDFSKYGLSKEPTVQESVEAGCDVVTFSGDKLLGGPQAGIIVGKRSIIDRIKKNPLTRALRIDKMTLAALESTLRLYRDEETAIRKIPTLRMLTMTRESTRAVAETIAIRLNSLNDSRIEISFRDLSSKAGGGSLPLMELPSTCLGIRVAGLSANGLEYRLRMSTPPPWWPGSKTMC